VSAWTALLESSSSLLRAPSFALFTDLLTGWVCAPGRRTITAMIAVADPAGARAQPGPVARNQTLRELFGYGPGRGAAVATRSEPATPP
jgi:hypothetical protein